MLKRLMSYLAVWLIVAGAATAAWAELESVSGVGNTEVFADGDPTSVELFPPAGPGAGFPLWYKDTNGLKLTLCVDGEEGEAPCAKEGSPVFTDAGCTQVLYDYQHVVGFGDEGFYYKVQSYPFDIPLFGTANAFAQLQYLVETTWGADLRFNPDTGQVDGQDIFLLDEAGECVSSIGADLHRVEEGFEMLFSRLRLRILDAAPSGWYRMTHPYGVKTMFREQADVDETRRTMARQLVGDLLVPEGGWGETTRLQNFLIALNDPYVLIDETNPDPFDPLHPYIGLQAETGFINDGDYQDEVERLNLKSVGPYLHKPDYLTDPTLQIEDEHGVVQQYIGRVPNEENPPASPGHEVVGSQFTDPLFPGEGVANFFKVRYLAGTSDAPPSDEAWQSAPVVGETAEFNVVGKVFPEPAATAIPASIGVFRNGSWYLDQDGDGAWNGAADTTYSFGLASDVAVTGDWDGDGSSQIGVYRNGSWYLDQNGDGAWNGAADTTYSFGLASDVPVTGDWNGDGISQIGVFRNGTWYLDQDGDGAWNGAADTTYRFGLASDVPVTGDWNGDGSSQIGVYRNGTWYLDQNGDGAWNGAADTTYSFGLASDLPVTGDWSGDGFGQIGVFRNGDWYLDADGNGIWEAVSDTRYRFGIAGDQPVSGPR